MEYLVGNVSKHPQESGLDSPSTRFPLNPLASIPIDQYLAALKPKKTRSLINSAFWRNAEAPNIIDMFNNLDKAIVCSAELMIIGDLKVLYSKLQNVQTRKLIRSFTMREASVFVRRLPHIMWYIENIPLMPNNPTQQRVLAEVNQNIDYITPFYSEINNPFSFQGYTEHIGYEEVFSHLVEISEGKFSPPPQYPSRFIKDSEYIPYSYFDPTRNLNIDDTHASNALAIIDGENVYDVHSQKHGIYCSYFINGTKECMCSVDLPLFQKKLKDFIDTLPEAQGNTVSIPKPPQEPEVYHTHYNWEKFNSYIPNYKKRIREKELLRKPKDKRMKYVDQWATQMYLDSIFKNFFDNLPQAQGHEAEGFKDVKDWIAGKFSKVKQVTSAALTPTLKIEHSFPLFDQIKEYFSSITKRFESFKIEGSERITELVVSFVALLVSLYSSTALTRVATLTAWITALGFSKALKDLFILVGTKLLNLTWFGSDFKDVNLFSVDLGDIPPESQPKAEAHGKSSYSSESLGSMLTESESIQFFSELGKTAMEKVHGFVDNTKDKVKSAPDLWKDADCISIFMRFGTKLLKAATMIKAIECIFKFFQTILNWMHCKYYGYPMGQEKTQVLVNDVKSWFQEYEKVFKRYSPEMMVKDIFFPDQCIKLYDKWIELSREMVKLGVPQANFSNFALCGNHTKSMAEYANTCKKELVGRVEPLVICLVGGSSVGKSTLIRYITRVLYEYECRINQVNYESRSHDSLCYYRKMKSDFWCRYRGQFVAVFDDIFTVRTSERVNDEAEAVIHAKNDAVESTEGASLHEKDSVFTSKVIILTSNATSLPTENNLTQPMAFLRRRDLVFNVTFQEKFSDPDKNVQRPAANMLPPRMLKSGLKKSTEYYEFNMLDPLSQVPKIIGANLNFKDVMNEICKKYYSLHIEAQSFKKDLEEMSFDFSQIDADVGSATLPYRAEMFSNPLRSASVYKHLDIDTKLAETQKEIADTMVDAYKMLEMDEIKTVTRAEPPGWNDLLTGTERAAMWQQLDYQPPLMEWTRDQRMRVYKYCYLLNRDVKNEKDRQLLVHFFDSLPNSEHMSLVREVRVSPDIVAAHKTAGMVISQKEAEVMAKLDAHKINPPKPAPEVIFQSPKSLWVPQLAADILVIFSQLCAASLMIVCGYQLYKVMTHKPEEKKKEAQGNYVGSRETKKTQRKYVRRNPRLHFAQGQPVEGVVVDRYQSIAEKVRKNVISARVYSQWDDKIQKDEMNATMLVGTYGVTVRHLFRNAIGAKKAWFEIAWMEDGEEKKFTCPFETLSLVYLNEWEDLRETESVKNRDGTVTECYGHDAAFFKLPESFKRQFADITHLWAYKDEFPDHVEFSSYVGPKGDTSVHSSTEQGKQLYTIKGIKDYTPDAIIKVSTMFVGRGKTEKGMCGIPILAQNVRFSRLLYGIHTAGGEGDAMTTPIFAESIMAFLTSIGCKNAKILSYSPFVPPDNLSEAHSSSSYLTKAEKNTIDFTSPPEARQLNVVGRLPPNLKVQMPRKTELEQTKFQDFASEWGYSDVRPMMLTPTDGISPLQNTVNRWKYPVKNNMDDDLLEDVIDFRFSKLTAKEGIDVMTDHAALNGDARYPTFKALHLNTAGGFTTQDVNKTQGKHPFVEQIGVKDGSPQYALTEATKVEVKKLEDRYLSQNPENLIETETAKDIKESLQAKTVSQTLLKDEWDDAAKYSVGKTRGISVYSFAHLFECRKYFGTLIECINADFNAWQVFKGMNPHRGQFSKLLDLYKTIQSDEIVGCDFDVKSFEYSLQRKLRVAVIKALVNWMYDQEEATGKWTLEELDRRYKIRLGLAYDCEIYNLCAVLDYLVATDYHGSGNFLTYDLGSLYEQVQTLYWAVCCYLKNEGEKQHGPWKPVFDKCWVSPTAGDDVVAVFAKFLAKYVNFQNMKTEAALTGVILTPSDSKDADFTVPYKNIFDCIFAGRRLKLDKNRVFCPLEKWRIFGRLYWARFTDGPKKVHENLAREVLEELVHYGREDYESWRKKLNIALNLMGYKPITKNYRDALDDFDGKNDNPEIPEFIEYEAEGLRHEAQMKSTTYTVGKDVVSAPARFVDQFTKQYTMTKPGAFMYEDYKGAFVCKVETPQKTFYGSAEQNKREAKYALMDEIAHAYQLRDFDSEDIFLRWNQYFWTDFGRHCSPISVVPWTPRNDTNVDLRTHFKHPRERVKEEKPKKKKQHDSSSDDDYHDLHDLEPAKESEYRIAPEQLKMFGIFEERLEKRISAKQQLKDEDTLKTAFVLFGTAQRKLNQVHTELVQTGLTPEAKVEMMARLNLFLDNLAESFRFSYPKHEAHGEIPTLAPLPQYPMEVIVDEDGVPELEDDESDDESESLDEFFSDDEDSDFLRRILFHHAQSAETQQVENAPTITTDGTISTFAELSEKQYGNFEQHAPHYNDVIPYPDHTLDEILSRTYLDGDEVWSSSSTFNEVIFSKILPQALLAVAPNITDKLNKFHFRHYSVKVTMRLNGTQFHEGAVIVAILPQNPGYTGDTYPTTNFKFDNVYTMSTLKWKVISASTSETTEFIIPYIAPRPHWEDEDETTTTPWVGTLVARVLVPLAQPGVTTAINLNFSIAYNLIAPGYSGPTYHDDLSGVEKSKLIKERLNFVRGPRGKARSPDNNEVQNPKHEAHSNSVAVEQRQKSSTGIISSALNAAGGVAAVVSKIPLVPAFVKVGAGVAGFLFKGAAMAAKFFGYDKPLSVKVERVIIPTTVSSLTEIDGLLNSHTLSVRKSNYVATEWLTNCDLHTKLPFLLSIPSIIYVGNFNASVNPGDVIWKIGVSPSVCYMESMTYPSGNTYFPAFNTIFSALTEMFYMWRGTIAFKVYFFCSAWKQARIRLSWHPTSSEVGSNIFGGTGDYRSEMVEIAGDTKSSLFVIPYDQSRDFKLVGNKQAMLDENINGVFAISAVNPPIVGTNTTDSTISFMVVAACAPTMQLRGLCEYSPFTTSQTQNPGQNFNVILNSTATLQGNYYNPLTDYALRHEAHSKSVDVSIEFWENQMDSPHHELIFENTHSVEEIKDVRDILHRSRIYWPDVTLGAPGSPSFFYPCQLDDPYTFVEGTTNVFDYCPWNPWNLLNHLFLYHKGGFNYKAVKNIWNQQTTSNFSWNGMIAAVQTYMYNGSPINPFTNATQGSEGQVNGITGLSGAAIEDTTMKSTLEWNIPHHADLSMLPGFPHLPGNYKEGNASCVVAAGSTAGTTSVQPKYDIWMSIADPFTFMMPFGAPVTCTLVYPPPEKRAAKKLGSIAETRS